MRPAARLFLAALLGAALAAVPGAAGAGGMEMLALSDVRCDSLTVSGSGLPANAALPISVSEEVDSPVLKRLMVSTDAAGTFEAQVQVSLAGMRRVAVAAAPGGSRNQIWGQHWLAAACPLPFTGPDRTLTLLLAALTLLGAGTMLSLRFSYRGRHERRPVES